MEVIVNIRNFLKKISFGCGLASLCCTLQASAFCGDNCCPTTCCEDGPLKCNAFGVQVKGGVTPTWFSDRGRLIVTNPAVFPSVFALGRSPEFDKLFDLPWQVGAELQWNASTHVQFFAEYVFENAKGKRHRFGLDNTGTTFLNNHFRDFETNGVYVGARYYFGNLWCSECGTSSIAPFIGFKGGVVWNEKTRFRGRLSSELVDIEESLGNQRGFRNRALLSAGAQFGVDWSFSCNWGAVLTVEIVGTQGPRNNRNIPIASALEGSPTNISLGDNGHLISVPVTLGVRYTF